MFLSIHVLRIHSSVCVWRHVWLVDIPGSVSSSHRPPVALPPSFLHLLIQEPWKPFSCQGSCLVHQTDLIFLKFCLFLNICFFQVSSPHVYPPQNTSPHMCQVTSPNLRLQTQTSSFQFPQSQMTSTHLTQPQVASPHLSPQMEVSPSHLFYQPQMTSAHLHSAQVNSSYHSPLLHSPQVSSLHLTPQPQLFLYNQNPDPELDYTDWNKCEASSDLSCYLNGSTFSYQVRIIILITQQNQQRV